MRRRPDVSHRLDLPSLLTKHPRFAKSRTSIYRLEASGLLIQCLDFVERWKTAETTKCNKGRNLLKTPHSVTIGSSRRQEAQISLPDRLGHYAAAALFCLSLGAEKTSPVYQALPRNAKSDFRPPFPGIPKGFNLSARGWPALRAYPGLSTKQFTTLKGLDRPDPLSARAPTKNQPSNSE